MSCAAEIDAEDLYSLTARQPLDDATGEMDAGGTDRPFAQLAGHYIRHSLKKAAFIHAGSA
jgi:hypothetical protein